MNPSTVRFSSHLLTIRLWQETTNDSGFEWRGTVQLVMTGERRHFRDWQTLVDHIKTMLPAEPTLDSDT